jgi:hypothetical protein
MAADARDRLFEKHGGGLWGGLGVSGVGSGGFGHGREGGSESCNGLCPGGTHRGVGIMALTIAAEPDPWGLTDMGRRVGLHWTRQACTSSMMMLAMLLALRSHVPLRHT